MKNYPDYIRSASVKHFVEQKSDEQNDSPPDMERRASEYEHYLNLDTTSLKGKRVLNIGSGLEGFFDKELAKQGAEVVSLSPYFANAGLGGKTMRESYGPSFRQKIWKSLRGSVPLPLPLPGIAEDLPLEDESIDTVLALYSVPLYSKDLKKMTSEILRVLSEGGEARLYPVSEKMRRQIDGFLSKNDDIQAEYQEVPEEGGRNSVFPGEKVYLLIIKRMR